MARSSKADDLAPSADCDQIGSQLYSVVNATELNQIEYENILGEAKRKEVLRQVVSVRCWWILTHFFFGHGRLGSKF